MDMLRITLLLLAGLGLAGTTAGADRKPEVGEQPGRLLACATRLEGKELAWPLNFSPDGRILALLQEDSGVTLWDVPAGKKWLSLKPPVGEGRGRGGQRQREMGCFPEQFPGPRSGDGHPLEHCLWRADHHPRRHTKEVCSLAFSPDSAILATGGGSRDQVIRLWDTSTGKLVGTLTGHKDEVHVLTFTPDGAALLSGGGDHTIKLWNWKEEEVTRLHQGGESGQELDRRLRWQTNCFRYLQPLHGTQAQPLGSLDTSEDRRTRTLRPHQ